MKNIVFKFLPLVAAVLFATSCSKDDGNDNSVVTDINTTTEPTTTEPSTAAPEPTNTVQVEVDENGIPYIPFSITVGEDTESLSKAYLETDKSSPDYNKYFFTSGDKIKVMGKNIEGLLESTLNPYNGEMAKSTTFSGRLSGTGVTSITAETQLTATLIPYYGGQPEHDGEPLTKPHLYNSVNSYSSTYFRFSKTFDYGQTEPITLEQHTAFINVKLGYSARLYVTIGSTEYPVDIPSFTGGTVAVPDGTKVRASFLKDEKTINVSGGNVIYNINRTAPYACIPAAFSISENEQVLFCKSNLSYYGSFPSLGYNEYWQWIIENEGNLNVGENHASVPNLDLFGWGTWVANHDGSTNPESTSTDYSTYRWTKTDPYASSEHRAPADNFADDSWFALTADEWNYLLNTRKMAGDETPRYIRASIKTKSGEMIPGLILFPDNETTTLSRIEDGFKIHGGVASSSYTDSFGNYIEEGNWDYFGVQYCYSGDDKSNLVFLPAAGYRNGTTITYNATGDDVAGYYWTSTSEGGYAYAMVFDKDKVKVTSQAFHNSGLLFKDKGFSVRLVHAMPTTKN